MRYIVNFLDFWRDFIIGDDWTIAAAVVAGLGLTGFLAHTEQVNAWWLLPLLVVGLLPVSIRRLVKPRD